MLASGGLGPRDVVAVARWAAARCGRAAEVRRHADTSLRAALDRAGVSGELRRVIDRFLAGVLLEDDGVTSNAFALLLIRMFVLGVPALPAEGMQALPRQLAAGLGDSNHVAAQRHRDHHSDGAGWQASDGTHAIRARHVVVATDAGDRRGPDRGPRAADARRGDRLVGGRRGAAGTADAVGRRSGAPPTDRCSTPR